MPRERSELLDIPNVGKATMGDLHRLGISTIAELKDHDPQQLYDNLCKLDGVQHDICCLDVFSAAVDFAMNGTCQDWWHYSKLRKAERD